MMDNNYETQWVKRTPNFCEPGTYSCVLISVKLKPLAHYRAITDFIISQRLQCPCDFLSTYTPGNNQMLMVSVCHWAAAFPFFFPTSSSLGSSSGIPLAKSSPLRPMASSLASKLHLPPLNRGFTPLGYRLEDEQETSLLLTEKKAEFIQNQITWSNRWSLLTYASSVWSSSFAILNSFWGSVH